MHPIRAVSAITALGLLLLLVSCAGNSENPVPDTVTLTMSVAPTSINNLGGTARVTARAVHAAGNVVVNDTRIVLTITSGDGILRTGSEQGRSVDTFTQNGEVSATFVSGEEIGTVTITAQTGSIGTDGSIAASVDVVDTYGTPTLLLNPSNLLRVGGQVVLSLLVTDSSGQPLPDESVVFSADRGSLDSNGNTVRTNRAGVATDTLSLAQPPDEVTEVNITATVGNKVVQHTVSVSTNINPVPVLLASPSAVTIDKDVFFDASTSTDPDGTVVTYTWWFGDGSTAEGMQVSHRYTEDDKYTVLLMVTDDAGAAAGTSTEITVGDNVGPTVTFEVSPSAPRVNEPTFFDARESTDSDGEIVRYDWNFGDGVLMTTTEPEIAHTYLSAETYTVLCTATDEDGATGTAKQTVTVVGNTLPTARLSASPNPVEVGEPMGFDATASTDEDGEIVAYRYDFGDGVITLGGPLIRHVYFAPGTYEVFLTVTDDEGGEGNVVLEVTVNENVAPTASFTTNTTKPGIAERVTFDGSASTDEDGEILVWEWFFGNGGYTRSGDPLAQTTYYQEGTYLVLLTVTDEEGGQGFTSSLIEVQENAAPTAAFVVSNSTPDVKEDISFDATGSADSDGEIVTYRWDFGETNTSRTTTEPLTRYQYTASGTYEVFLRVTDDLGAFGFVTEVVRVGTVANEAPTAKLSFLPKTPIAGKPVGFDASESADSDGDIVNYAFDFGDGTSLPKSVTPLVSYTYGSTGTFVVFLTVRDNEGAFGYASESVEIDTSSNVAPKASFDISNNAPTNAEPVLFTSTSTDDNGQDTIISFSWTFGDGTSGSGTPVSHTFSTAGTYSVTLVVGDSGGLYDAVMNTVAVSTARTPKARLRLLPGPDPHTLVLDASGSEDPETLLEQLQFTMTGHAPPGVHLAVPKGNAPMRIVHVDENAKNIPLTFALTVTDGEGRKDTAVASAVWPLDREHIGPSAHLQITPDRLPEGGGTVLLDARGTVDPGWPTKDLDTQFWAETTGSAKVRIVGKGQERRAEITGGKAGEVVTFRLRTANPQGRSDVVTRALQLAPHPSAGPPRVQARIVGSRYQGDKLILDLDASATTDPNQVLPASAFTWRTLAARPGTKAMIWTRPTQPGRATATIEGAKPGDWLRILVRATDDSGLHGRHVLRFQAPGR